MKYGFREPPWIMKIESVRLILINNATAPLETHVPKVYEYDVSTKPGDVLIVRSK